LRVRIAQARRRRPAHLRPRHRGRRRAIDDVPVTPTLSGRRAPAHVGLTVLRRGSRCARRGRHYRVGQHGEGEARARIRETIGHRTTTVRAPAVVGAPVMRPVELPIERPDGRPVAEYSQPRRPRDRSRRSATLTLWPDDGALATRVHDRRGATFGSGGRCFENVDLTNVRRRDWDRVPSSSGRHRRAR